jgi:sugar/nucleoside kinase (ribokinase family)
MKGNSLAFRPVGLAMHSIGGCRVINSVERAAETLLQRWPIDDGEDFSEAVMACLDGLHNRIPPEDVRAAFIKAAREANMIVIQSVKPAHSFN